MSEFESRVAAAQEAVLLVAPLHFEGDVFDIIEVHQVGLLHIRFGIVGSRLNLAGNVGDMVDIGCVEIAFWRPHGVIVNLFDIVIS